MMLTVCAGLSETARRAAGVDLRAKQAYAERLRAQGSSGGAADASTQTVSPALCKSGRASLLLLGPTGDRGLPCRVPLP